MTTPDPPGTPAAFAPIEDLDPAATARAHRSRRWELVIGLALVLGLAAFGGWQWWQQQGKLTAYQAGSRAAAAHDWEAASTAFARAGDYSDAASRHADAQRLVAERDRQYAQASQAAAQHDWPRVLQAVQQLEGIAPNFRDTPTLGRQARQAVYSAALSGTVALRPHAAPPGLYTYGSAGWQWLHGSDGASHVLDFCPDGSVLIDAPDVLTPPTTLLIGPPTPPARSGDETNRRILAVAPDGARPPRSVTLAPSRFNQFVCTSSGVWGSVEYLDTRITAPLTRQFLAPAATMSYQAWDAPAPLTPALSAPDWSVLNITPDGRHILAAQNTGRGPDGQQFRVYLADPGGGAVRPLGDFVGTLVSSDFSPNGRYLLIMTFRIFDPIEGVDTLYFLDLAAGGPPVQLTQASLSLGQSYALLDPAATFVQAGSHAGQMLIAQWGNGRQFLRLLDPAHLDRPLAEIPMDNVPAQLRFIVPDPTSSVLVLGWQNSQTAAEGPSNTLAVLDAQGQATLIHPLTDAVADLESAGIRQGYLTFLARIFNIRDQQATYAWRARALADPADDPTRATTLYSRTIPWLDSALAEQQNPPWHLGPGLLAYITPSGDLHTRTYDGALDLLLESGVTALYAPP